MNSRFKTYIIVLLVLFGWLGFMLNKDMKSARSRAIRSNNSLEVCKQIATKIKQNNKPSYTSTVKIETSSSLRDYANKIGAKIGLQASKIQPSSAKQICKTDYKLITLTINFQPASLEKIVRFAHMLAVSKNLVPNYMTLRAISNSPSDKKWKNTLVFNYTYYSPKK